MRGIYSNYGCGFGHIGRGWAPKRQRHMVGRDLAPIHKDGKKQETNGIVLADSAKQLEQAQKEAAQAESRARLGFSLKNEITSSMQGESLRQEQLLASGAGESVYLVQIGGEASLRIENAEGEERIVNLKGNEDIRIGWSEDGKAQIFTGEAALKNGKLVAQGENDVLIRLSSVDVEAGSGTTVLNLSGKSGGSFSGGHNVRYLGAYNGSNIESGTGDTNFEGYFGGSQINAEKGRGNFSGVFNGFAPESFIKAGSFDNLFSGYFLQMELSSSGGRNEFSGTFLRECLLESSEGDDTFSGRFFDSKIKDAGGDNSFGSYMNLKNKVELNFVRTIIEAGEGDDTFTGFAEQSEISLGGGNDKATGILRDSTLDAGDGADEVKIFYATGSLIDMGKGDDDLHLITGSGNSVRLGEGDDKMTSGLNAGSRDGSLGTIRAYARSAFISEEQASEGMKPKFGHHFGDVQSTDIDASEGENNISVHDGMNVHSVKTGENKEEDPAALLGSEGAAILDGSGLIGGRASTDSVMQKNLMTGLKKILARAQSGDDEAISQELRERLHEALRVLEEDKELDGPDGKSGNRFMVSALGGWLPNPAGNSVTITGGNGETLSFDRMERNIFEGGRHRSGRHLRKLLHQYRQFTGINS